MPWAKNPAVRTEPVPLPPNFDEDTAPEDLYDSGERKSIEEFVDIMMGEVVRHAECRKLIGIKTVNEERLKWMGRANGDTVRKRADGAAVFHVWEMTPGFRDARMTDHAYVW